MNALQERLISALGAVLDWSDRVFGTSFLEHHYFNLKGAKMTGEPPLPLDGFISPFNSVTEWLSHICDTIEPPQTYISELTFIFFGFDGQNSLGLFGYHHTSDEDGPVKSMDFTLPPEMYLTLHQEEFTKLSAPQLRERIANELKKFTTTPAFHRSFFSKSQTISCNSIGDIWSA